MPPIHFRSQLDHFCPKSSSCSRELYFISIFCGLSLIPTLQFLVRHEGTTALFPLYVPLRAYISMKTMSSATEDRGPLFLQAIWIEAAIASLFVAARIFARIKIQGKLSLDDYLMVLALVIRSLPELRS